LNGAKAPRPQETISSEDNAEASDNFDAVQEIPIALPPSKGPNVASTTIQVDGPISKVFISQGSNKKILEQLKEIVRYGKFDPVVSVEKETVSKPVPEKVMDDMRSAQASVIHVAVEKMLADDEGKIHPQINPNVLIEIGAAMALHKRRFILLVENGVQLPSNLQGLYECRYDGESLDGFATMKLLKAFNEFST
jgi:predicted nucleotide-binding protein